MKTIKSTLPLLLSALALAVAITSVPMDASGRPPLGVSNFDSIHLRDANGTATPNFVADQRGSGVIAEFRDGGTPVARFPNGGGFSLLSGAFSQAGDLSVTGALTVTSGAWLDSTLDVDGLVSSGTGSFSVSDTINVIGAADFDDTFNADGNATFGGTADVAGTLQFGADDNFALGYASSAQEFSCVSTTITGTAAVEVTGITTPTFAMATLVTDPGTGAGDPFLVTVDEPSTTTVVVNVWQDDVSAGASGAVVHVCAVGDE